MAPVSLLRSPPLRRRALGKALVALIAFVIALSALAAPPPGAAYSCSAGEGRNSANRVDDCRRPVREPKESRRMKAEKQGRMGVTPLILLVLALVGTLALPIGFDRMTRKEEHEPDRLLR
jgi:hypothetical protein